jgi:hypothetical protein
MLKYESHVCGGREWNSTCACLLAKLEVGAKGMTLVGMVCRNLALDRVVVWPPFVVIFFD